MRTIGIRVKPTEVTFSVYDSDENIILNIESVKVPSALRTPEALKYVRSIILDVLIEYDVRHAGLRVTEPTAKSQSAERIQIEGVIQEAFASSMLDRYYIGQISSISSKIAIARSEFKKYVDGELNFDRVANWPDLSKEERESVLTALGAINA